MISREDERVKRCPQLGHEVSFHYCRTLEKERLCPKILNCWWEIFDVEGFLREELSDEAFMRLTNQPSKPRVNTILELIAKAKQSER